MLDELDRDSIALVIAQAEDDDGESTEMLLAPYFGSQEALCMLVLNLVKLAHRGFTEAVRFASGLGPDDELPDGAVQDVLRRYLAP